MNPTEGNPESSSKDEVIDPQSGLREWSEEENGLKIEKTALDNSLLSEANTEPLNRNLNLRNKSQSNTRKH